MATDYDRDLDELRWHWGDAYVLEYFGGATWVAQRRDSHSTLGAKTAPELLDKIRADYLSHPVSRRISRPGISGGTRSGRGICFPPEG